MGYVTELRDNVHKQFQTSRDILQIARELNAVGLRLADEGRTEDAEALKQSISRLVDQVDKLTAYTRASGMAVADALRNEW